MPSTTLTRPVTAANVPSVTRSGRMRAPQGACWSTQSSTATESRPFCCQPLRAGPTVAATATAGTATAATTTTTGIQRRTARSRPSAASARPSAASTSTRGT